MNNSPDIETLDEGLFKVNAMMGAAESHGALCGMLCARGGIELSEWLSHVLGEQEQGNVLLHELVHQLSDLHQLTMESMNDISAGFELLLPDDDYELIGRTEALANWCQGFVYGLAAGGISQDSKLPGDTAEILMDFVEISRASHELGDDLESREQDEQAFVEIVEYVRTGVMLINEELQSLTPSTTVH